MSPLRISQPCVVLCGGVLRCCRPHLGMKYHPRSVCVVWSIVQTGETSQEIGSQAWLALCSACQTPWKWKACAETG